MGRSPRGERGGGWGAAFGGGGTPDFTGGPELDEPPLLEELGIDPGQIVRRTIAMLNPMGRADDNAGDDDLAGPLLFAFPAGALHLLRGRVHFGYILGWFTLSTMAMYWLLNQLAAHGEGIELYRTGSVVGYCMLPMCLPRRARRRVARGARHGRRGGRAGDVVHEQGDGAVHAVAAAEQRGKETGGGVSVLHAVLPLRAPLRVLM